MRNALILHHNDRDGYMSALIYKYHILTSIYDKINNIYTKEVDYSERLDSIIKECEDSETFDSFNRIYLLDYSISNEDNKNTIIRLNNDERYDVVWIDHHISSLQMIADDTSGELKKIQGLRVNGLAGAALTWIYTHGFHAIPLYVTQYIIDHHDKVDKIDADTSLSLLEYFKLPIHVLYTHMYDVFIINDKVLHFNYGFNIRHISKLCDIDEFDLVTYNNYKAEQRFNRSIEMGKEIKSYIDEKNKELVLNCSKVYAYKNMLCLTLNHTQFSSLVFGNLIDCYDFVMVYARQGSKWKHSLYTNNKLNKDVDCSVIAKRFGGGGHCQAAGFFSDVPFYELDGKPFQ